MGINTVLNFALQTLNGMDLPLGLGPLTAQITPPNPGEAVTPQAYIWGSHGDEKRLTVPRAVYQNLASGGDKTLTHRLDIWLIVFLSTEDPGVDVQFPTVIDAVLAQMRNVEMSDGAFHARDPVTGVLSQLLNWGENMTYDWGPARAVSDQRYFRYDALINVETVEVIQA
jgi:hypothetical protein